MKYNEIQMSDCQPSNSEFWEVFDNLIHKTAHENLVQEGKALYSTMTYVNIQKGSIILSYPFVILKTLNDISFCVSL